MALDVLRSRPDAHLHLGLKQLALIDKDISFGCATTSSRALLHASFLPEQVYEPAAVLLLKATVLAWRLPALKQRNLHNSYGWRT